MTYNELWRQLAQVYDDGEAKALARMAYEVRFGLTFADLCLGKDTQLSADCQAELEEIARCLLNEEPIQYILGEATFCGRTFTVNEHVLIPRPETEELCRWILQNLTRKQAPCEVDDTGGQPPCTILDIGTGSGCISVTLAAEIPQAQVTGWDISASALAVARENARRHNVSATFEQVDVLSPHPSSLISHFSLIVSNPPYICNKERARMERNVLDHEPHEALFVPDDDPLLFYRAIARYAANALKPGGWLYFEINPLYADDLQALLSAMRFYLIETHSDQYGKQRMLRAQR